MNTAQIHSSFKSLSFLVGMWALVVPQVLQAQSNYASPYTFATLAGNAGTTGSSNGTGSSAQFNLPDGVAVDSAGYIYVADTGNQIIRKISPGGAVTTLAGSPGQIGSSNGTGSAALFYNPYGVAVDGSGNVYVADSGNSTIRMITPGGVVSTLAGSAGNTGSSDGAGSTARFNHPCGVAVDISGNVYVADTNNSTIRKIAPAGGVTTLAGTAGSTGSNNGTGSAAQFHGPIGLAVDSTGDVYVADTNNQNIRMITSAGVVTTVAGLAGNPGSSDGTGSAARFFLPEGVAVDSSGYVYVSDHGFSNIRMITPAASVTTLAGTAGTTGSTNGTGSAALFNQPTGLAIDGSGNVYVADSGNSTIRKGVPPLVITSVSPIPVIGSNGQQSFTINGSGFVVGCNATLRDLTAGQTFAYRAISSFSNRQIIINPNFTTSAHSWSVEVINPNNATTGQYDFNVVAPLNSWTSRSSGTANNLSSITAGNGTIVAVGANGTILTSSDGITWTLRGIGSPALQGVTYGNGLFVAVGASGTILTSPDGITWTPRTSGTTVSIQGVAYGNGVFTAIARISSSITLTSPDGINWSVGTLTSAFSPASIAFCGNQFLVNAGYYYTSSNGTTWARSATTSSTNIDGFAFGNNTYVSAGVGPKISTASNGLTWTSQVSGTTNGLLNVTYGNGFVAVGATGTILSSTDGISWIGSTSGTTNNLNSTIYVNGSFFVVGNSGTILQSNSVPASVPLITSVNPNPALAQNGAQTFTINGSNFTTGCTVTLRDLGAGQIFTNRTITSQTSSQIVLSPNLTSTPATWSVEVINAVGASSGQYQFQVGTGVTPTLVTSPATSATFTPVEQGSSSTSTVTLTNNGTTTISGSATVKGPFTILGSATYSLQPGQQQTFVVQFTPTGVGSQTGYVIFSGGTGTSIQLYGNANATSATGTITGTVTDSTTGKPVDGVRVSTMTGDMDTTALSLATGQDGVYTIKNVPPGNYILSATAPANNYFYYQQQATVTADATIPVNISLVPTPTPSQTATLTLNIPVLFVRGIQIGPEPSLPDSYWGDLYTHLKSQGFVNLWDPDAVTMFYSSTSTATSEIIDGKASVDADATALKTYLGIQAQNFMTVYGSIPTINIVAHSMGCLIVREALNNQNYIHCPLPGGGYVDVPIKQVIMLAPPNAGASLADMAWPLLDPNVTSSTLATLPDYSKLTSEIGEAVSLPAIGSLTTTYVQNEFTYSWPNSVPCFLFAGTGGNAINAGSGLTNIMTYLYLAHLYTLSQSHGVAAEMVDDGVVTRPSVSGQYYINGALQSCVDVNDGINETTDVDALGESLNHLSMLNDLKVSEWVTSILQTGQMPTPMTAEAITANAKASSIRTKVALTSSLTTSTEQIDNQTGSLSQGSTATRTVACDGQTTFTLNLLASASGINFTLGDPSGNVINSSSTQTNPNVAYIQNTDPVSGIVSTTYTISNPAAGTWTVTLDGTALTQSSASYQLFVSGDSDVALQPTTASFFHSNREAVISCSLLNTGATPATPVSATSVTAQIVYPDGTVNTQALLDDGFHGDGGATDGVYGAILPNLTEPGQYYVTYNASGNYALNQPFTRYATSSFTVSSEDASIAGNLSSQVGSLNGHGTTQSIRVNCLVNVNVSGTYLLSGVLTDSTGTLQIPASVQMVNAPVGTSMVTLYFDLSTFQAAGYTGPATLTNLQLAEQTSTTLQWVDTYPASFSIQIAPAITSGTPPATGGTGTAYSFTFTASGYPPPTFALSSGSLPPGLTLSPTGVLSGTPTQTGNFFGTVTATNVAGTVGTQSFTITITGTGGATDTPTMPPWGLAVLGVLLMMTAAKCLPRLSTVSATNTPTSRS